MKILVYSHFFEMKIIFRHEKTFFSMIFFFNIISWYRRIVLQRLRNVSGGLKALNSCQDKIQPKYRFFLKKSTFYVRTWLKSVSSEPTQPTRTVSGKTPKYPSNSMEIDSKRYRSRSEIIGNSWISLVFRLVLLENSCRENRKNHSWFNIDHDKHVRKVWRKSHGQSLRSASIWFLNTM